MRKINIILALFCLSSLNLEIEPLFIPDPDDEIEEQELREAELLEEKKLSLETCPTESKITRLIKDLYAGIKPSYEEAKTLLSNKQYLKECLAVATMYALIFATKHFAAKHFNEEDPLSGSYAEFSTDLGQDPKTLMGEEPDPTRYYNHSYLY